MNDLEKEIIFLKAKLQITQNNLLCSDRNQTELRCQLTAALREIADLKAAKKAKEGINS